MYSEINWTSRNEYLLTFITKVQISDTRCFDKPLSKLLKLIHLSFDSSHVCLNNFRTYNNKSQMFRPFSISHNSNYEEGCRNHNRIWKCKYHNFYLLKIYLVKVFPHNHFHEFERNLMTLRFYGVCVPIHVNLSIPIYNHKTILLISCLLVAQ